MLRRHDECRNAECRYAECRFAECRGGGLVPSDDQSKVKNYGSVYACDLKRAILKRCAF